MVDFSVEGITSLKDQISDGLERMQRAAFGTAGGFEAASESADEFSVDLGELAGMAEVTEEQVQDVNQELREIGANAQVAAAGIAQTETAMLSSAFGSPVGSKRGGLLGPDEIFDRTARDLDIDRSLLGGIKGRISQGSIQNFEKLSKELRDASNRFMTTREAAERFQSVLRDAGVASRFAASGIDEAGDEAAEAAAEAQTAQSRFSKLNREFGVGTAAAATMSGTLGFLTVSMAATDAEAEDLQDTFQRLSREMPGLADGMSTLSANIGPFNIGLRNILVTLPILLGLFGTFAAIIGGLAGAFIVAAGALSAFLAVGAFGLANQMEQNFASITNKAEAMEAIFKGLSAAISEAVEPLADTRVLGLTPVQLFIALLQDMVFWVRQASLFFSDILQMREVEEFLLDLRAALLGLDDDPGPSLLEATKVLIRSLLPAATDFLTFFINKLPEFFTFAAHISDELLPVLGKFSDSLIDFSVQLSRLLGGEMLPALLFLLGGFFDMLTSLLKWVNDLADRMGIWGDVVVGTVIVLGTLLVVIGKLIAVYKQFLILNALTQIALGKTITEIFGLSGAVSVLNANLAVTAGLLLTILGALAAVALPTAGLALVANENMSERHKARRRAQHRASPGGTRITAGERQQIQNAPQSGGTGDIININVDGMGGNGFSERESRNLAEMIGDILTGQTRREDGNITRG